MGLHRQFTLFINHQWSKILRPTQEQELSLTISNYQINYTGPSLENLRDAKYIHLFETTFGVLILQMCNF